MVVSGTFRTMQGIAVRHSRLHMLARVHAQTKYVSGLNSHLDDDADDTVLLLPGDLLRSCSGDTAKVPLYSGAGTRGVYIIHVNAVGHLYRSKQCKAVGCRVVAEEGRCSRSGVAV